MSGFAVIHSETRAAEGSAPAAAIRTRSRSVRIPVGLGPSTTTTEPTFCSRMRAATCATVSSGAAVATGELINSPTVVGGLAFDATTPSVMPATIVGIDPNRAPAWPCAREPRELGLIDPVRCIGYRQRGRLKGAVT